MLCPSSFSFFQRPYSMVLYFLTCLLPFWELGRWRVSYSSAPLGLPESLLLPGKT